MVISDLRFQRVYREAGCAELAGGVFFGELGVIADDATLRTGLFFPIGRAQSIIHMQQNARGLEPR